MTMWGGKSGALLGMLGLWAATSSGLSCGSSVSITMKCKAGATQSCDCATGGFGTQSCGSDQQFGPCTCTPVSTGTGGSRPSSDASSGLDASGTPDGPPLATGTLVASGTS